MPLNNFLVKIWVSCSESFFFVDFEGSENVLDIFTGLDEEIIVDMLGLESSISIRLEVFIGLSQLFCIIEVSSALGILVSLFFVVILFLKILPLLKVSLSLVFRDSVLNILNKIAVFLDDIKVLFEVLLEIRFTWLENGFSLFHKIVLLFLLAIVIVVVSFVVENLLAFILIEDSFSHILALLKSNCLFNVLMDQFD